MNRKDNIVIEVGTQEQNDKRKHDKKRQFIPDLHFYFLISFTHFQRLLLNFFELNRDSCNASHVLLN